MDQFCTILKFARSTAIALLAFLACACSEDYIPLGEYRIEPDPYIPKLHGLVVKFKYPMIYELLDKKDSGYRKEVIDVGRVLMKRDSRRKKIKTNPSKFEEITEGMSFTIKSSYWYRRDWFNKSLNDDLRSLILVDENGVESDALYIMLLYSDHSYLLQYENEGKLRNPPG